jgi:uncharacterized protein (DUF433 family)
VLGSDQLEERSTFSKDKNHFQTVMERKQVISRDPEVMNGALVFAGTRVPVEILIQHLAAGDPLDIFLDDFPSVSREQAVAYLELTLREAEAAA